MLAASSTFTDGTGGGVTTLIVGPRKRSPSSGRTRGAWSGRSALLRAVARRDLLLGGVLGRRVLDQRRDDGVVGGVPVGDHVPLLAVPLVDAAEAGAFMVGARHLDRSDHTLEAELL